MVLLAIALGILPGFAWLLFYLKEDLHPEPKKLIAGTFIAGAAITMVALAFQCFTFQNVFGFNSCEIRLEVAVNSLVAWPGIPVFLPGLLLVIALALIEEVLKFAAVYFAVSKNPNFNEPVDPMIYMVVAALGFATVENLAVATSSINSLGKIEFGTFIEMFRSISFRFIGATLLHTLASGLVGYYWAISIREFEKKSIILWGIVIATALHAIFNYLIIKFDDRFYLIVLLLVVGFLVITDFEKLKRKSI